MARDSKEWDVHKTKPSGVSYRKLAVIVLITVLISAAVCAAIVVPLFNNLERENAKVEVIVTSPKPPETITETECGKVQGEISQGVYVFKGIPYADPPVGKLRWKPPVPKSLNAGNCWTGTYKALEFGNECYQNLSGPAGSEDCLYLNVWTPSLDRSAELPVMVYIHGGNLQVLNGNFPNGSPTTNVTSDTQAVYVSLNYRLNIFGFLALDLLTNNSTTNTSGNYGFMDQLLVLEWVQKNIRKFGGNPSLVTIFGESSGGTSVLALLASPLSKGLFHRAWLMSSSVVLNKTLDQASKDNLIILNKTGCADLDCLYNLSSEQLLSAIPLYEWPHWIMDDLTYLPTKGLFNGALAIVDGYVLKEEPLEAFRAGRGMAVPVMIGTLQQENDMIEPAPGIRTWSWDNYTNYITTKMKPFGDDIVNKTLEMYPPLQNSTPEFQLTTLSTDIRCTCPNEVLATALSSSSTLRVYRYIVTSYPTTPIQIFGLPFAPKYSFHGWDMLVFFNELKIFFPQPSKSNLAFKRLQQEEVIYFTRNGFPYSQNWKSYPNSTAFISDVFQTAGLYHSEECKFWLDNGFFSYGWIN